MVPGDPAPPLLDEFVDYLPAIKAPPRRRTGRYLTFRRRASEHGQWQLCRVLADLSQDGVGPEPVAVAGAPVQVLLDETWYGQGPTPPAAGPDTAAPPETAAPLETAPPLEASATPVAEAEAVREGAPESVANSNVAAQAWRPVDLREAQVSPDGHWIAFVHRETHGCQVRLRDLDSERDVPVLLGPASGSLAWSGDSKGLYWVESDGSGRAWRLRRHLIGSGEPDQVVLEEADVSSSLSVRLCRSGAQLIVTASGPDTTEEWLLEASGAAPEPRCVQPRRPGVEYAVDYAPRADGDRLLIVADDTAPESRLCRVAATRSSAENWEPLIEADPSEPLLDAHVFARHAVLTLRQGGESMLRILFRDGSEHAIDVHPGLPGGAITLEADQAYAASSVLVRVSNWTEPTAWFSVDLDSGARTLVQQVRPDRYEPQAYVSERRWVAAPDGVRIPVTLARRATTPLDGTAPCLLRGHGAAAAIAEPSFDPILPSLLDRGAVFAFAHVRGGGELGRRWWYSGRGAAKATTFTDYLAVADHLAAGLVDGDRIVSRGRGLGGLLQAAVLLRHPDRWSGVVLEQPLLDVERLVTRPGPALARARLEFGSAQSETELEALRTWSPWSAAAPDVCPPLLLMTGGATSVDAQVWARRIAARGAAAVTVSAAPGRPTSAGTLDGLAALDDPHDMADPSRLRYEATVLTFVLDRLGLR